MSLNEEIWLQKLKTACVFVSALCFHQNISDVFLKARVACGRPFYEPTRT